MEHHLAQASDLMAAVFSQQVHDRRLMASSRDGYWLAPQRRFHTGIYAQVPDAAAGLLVETRQGAAGLC